ncbi:MAG TPA: hypothetical protein VGU20_31070 [Stellaceae bacterium]|nr:hypothetical protein [Terriglobia bacterium]HEV2551793.1 hypothetical protein [Stellaceae bacterium]
MTGVETSGCPRPDGLIEVDTVLDIGAGLRPMGWYKPKRHICVEPHPPYAERLKAAGYEVWCETAASAVGTIKSWGPGSINAIYLLDVIEHMPRAEGEALLKVLPWLEAKQIVVFTPTGFMAQEHDAWGLGGEHWQKHRSGWTPEDFAGWRISYPLGASQFMAVSP